MEASYHVDGPRQEVRAGSGDRALRAWRAWCPRPLFQRSDKAYPMLRYPWAQARAALEALAADQPSGLEAVQITLRQPRDRRAGARTSSATTR